MDHQIRNTILETLREFSTPARPVYLVGGAVRDTLLGLPIHDFDFALPGETISLAREAARRLDGALYVLDEERNTTRVVLDLQKHGGKPSDRISLDFAGFRAADITGDLRSRDFTINALAYDLASPNHLVDPTGGLRDIQEKRIRACSSDSLLEDPVRVVRAVRQSVKLRFRIEPETFQWMRSASPLLMNVSPERIRDELFRILEGPQVALALRVLDRAYALALILPELEALKGISQSAPHTLDVWEHTMSVVQYLEQVLAPLVGLYREESVADLSIGSAVLWVGRYRDALLDHFSQKYVPDRSIRSLLFLAALYHDAGKPGTREETADGRVRFLRHPEVSTKLAGERAHSLMLSTHEIERLQTVVMNHMRVHFMANRLVSPGGQQPSRRVMYRFFNETGPAGIDICLLSLADIRGTFGAALPQNAWEAELSVCRDLLEAYWDRNPEIISPPRLLSGNDLIELFDLKPGKIIGQLLEAVREAQAAGEIGNRDDAEQFAGRWLKDHSGNSPALQDASRVHDEEEE